MARAPELDFISQGRTPEEARKNLLEVIGIQFEEMKNIGTLDEYVQECGFDTNGEEITPQIEIRVRRSRRRNNQEQHADSWYDKGTIF